MMNLGRKEIKYLMDSATCVLLDIEGTTTSIDFVRKDLRDYGIQNIEKYIADHWNDPEVQKVVEELRNSENKDGLAVCSDVMTDAVSNDELKTREAVINNLKTVMRSNEKSTAVKEIEGLVMMNGFVNGDLIGHIYPDVVDALKLWNHQGKKIYIYSNGSVQSQHLLFKRNIHGDLRKYIDGNFDTTIGSKLEPTSYSKICQAIEKSPNEIVFFSDRPQEIFAAKQAGLKIVLLVRNPECLTFPDEMDLLKPNDPTINSFVEVLNYDEKER